MAAPEPICSKEVFQYHWIAQFHLAGFAPIHYACTAQGLQTPSGLVSTPAAENNTCYMTTVTPHTFMEGHITISCTPPHQYIPTDMPG